VSIDLDAIDVVLTVTTAVDRLGVIHTVGGSIASSMAGVPRFTSISLRPSRLGPSRLFVAALEPDRTACGSGTRGWGDILTSRQGDIMMTR
jgi:hypothetical protein